MKRIIWGREKRYRTAVFSRRIAGHSTEFTHQEAARWVRENGKSWGRVITHQAVWMWVKRICNIQVRCSHPAMSIRAARVPAVSFIWQFKWLFCKMLTDRAPDEHGLATGATESKSSTYDSVWDSMTFHLNYCIHSHFSRISEDSVSHVNRLMAYKDVTFHSSPLLLNWINWFHNEI